MKFENIRITFKHHCSRVWYNTRIEDVPHWALYRKVKGIRKRVDSRTYTFAQLYKFCTMYENGEQCMLTDKFNGYYVSLEAYPRMH